MRVREFFKAMGAAVVELVNKLLTVDPPAEKTCANCYYFRGKCLTVDPELCKDNERILWLPREEK